MVSKNDWFHTFSRQQNTFDVETWEPASFKDIAMIVLNIEAAVSTPGNFYTVSNIQKWKNKHPKMNLVEIVVKL